MEVMKKLNRKELMSMIFPVEVGISLPQVLEIHGVTTDSRKVVEGGVFIAIKGEDRDGHQYVNDAIKRGAKFIIVEREVEAKGDVEIIKVSDTHFAASALLRWYYDYPDENLFLVGITGTNGKTTISYLLESILKTAGAKTGVIGTVSWRYGNIVKTSTNTTPSLEEIIVLLSEMRDSGVEAVVMEVSSHGLKQKRVKGINFDGGIFTNLTRDHLDYHRTMDDYFNAKAILFKDNLEESKKKNKWGVVNRDDQYVSSLLEEQFSYPIYSFGFSEGDARVLRWQKEDFILKAEINVLGRVYVLKSELFGKHNLLNILAAFLAGLLSGVPGEIIVKGIEALKSVPGRLEKIRLPSGAVAIIDYAHTPDAIANVLSAVKEWHEGKGRIITVFGAGGDRDKGKREPMGETAGELSDFVVITSDNPRSEDPEEIMRMVEEGVIKTGVEYKKIVDRREAILFALSIARNNDIVMVLGKGHEDYQILGNEKIHFSDREIVEEFVRGRK